MGSLTIKGGHIVLLDDEDLDRMSRNRWALKNSKNGGAYVVRFTKRDGRPKMLLMHREILNAPPGVPVDHINRDTLDNRKGNLRLATNSLNQANSRKSPRRNTSKYKGVCWHKQAQRWQAAICINGERRYLGLFEIEEDAARAYDNAARELFGEFANPNFAEAS